MDINDEEDVLEDLYDQIRADHITVLNMFDELQDVDPGDIATRTDLFSSLQRELTLHMKAEEVVWYSALKGKDKSRKNALKATQEHVAANMILSDLGKKQMDDENWYAQLSVLRDVLEEHIEDEEDEMFELSNSVFSLEELEGMGALFTEKKSEFDRGSQRRAA